VGDGTAAGFRLPSPAYTQPTVPIAIVALEFDPFLRLGDRLVGLETLVLAAGVLGAILLAARIALRTPAGEGDPSHARGDRLRPDDLVFIVLAAIPGAVVGGRLGYGLLHLDYYGGHPGAILDPGQGSLQLGLAIVGGALTGGWAARLLGEPVGRWFHVAALPLLVAIAVGKLAMALGGSGQGLPSGLPWATSYLGAGPWGSLAPELPSHPAQLYEAGATVIVLAGAIGLLASGYFARPDGRLFLAALAGWAGARTVVAATWRDAPVFGPLLADQLLSIAIAGTCAAILLSPREDRAALGAAIAEGLRRIGLRRPAPEPPPRAADSPQGSIVRRRAARRPDQTKREVSNDAGRGARRRPRR
jgi:prolipoprotein diacylglyceryltransferase